MPIYVYEPFEKSANCTCGGSFEKMEPMSATALTECPECNCKIRRVIQSVRMVQGKKGLLSDKNIKKKGFTKLVNEGDGKFRKI